MKLDDPFALRTRSGATVGDILLPRLKEHGGPIQVVDAGARNGMAISPTLARNAKFIAFEPNPEEYEKLVAHRTDAEVLHSPVARFAQEEYHNCALWDREETRSFYITAGTGACTLMGEATGGVAERMWLEGKDKTYTELHTAVRRSLPMRCRRLDDVLGGDARIDYLKVDVEGAELALLQGATRLFERGAVLLIKTEFQLTPYYGVHPLLGHQHVFLHERGFRLIDIDASHPRYTRDRTAIPPLADRRLMYAGDAYFILDPERTALPPRERLRMGIVAIALRFFSLGVSLVRDSGLVSAEEAETVSAALGKVPFLRRLRYSWNQVPAAAGRWLARLRR
jgi:FkbM family methyltransferase